MAINFPNQLSFACFTGCRQGKTQLPTVAEEHLQRYAEQVELPTFRGQIKAGWNHLEDRAALIWQGRRHNRSVLSCIKFGSIHNRAAANKKVAQDRQIQLLDMCECSPRHKVVQFSLLCR